MSYVTISPQLFAGPVQELYADDPRVWNKIFEIIVKDLAMAQRDGIDVGSGQRIYPIILGNKGDWSYLETCMMFMLFWNLSLYVCEWVFHSGSVYINQVTFCERFSFVFEMLLNVFYLDSRRRALHGVMPPKFSQRLFWVIIHKATKVASANLERSYRRAPKAAGDMGDHGIAGAGICHLCLCGQGVDWENLLLDFASVYILFELKLG